MQRQDVKFSRIDDYGARRQAVSGSWRAALLALGCALLLGACSVTRLQDGAALDPAARWIQLPLVNLAESPRAAERAEAILATHLRARGVRDLASHTERPDAGDSGLLEQLDDSRRQREALLYARAEGYRYAVAGSVDEWGYKRGLDGEPAVGISLQLIDAASGAVLWSASGARTGWGFESAAGAANRLLDELLDGLPLQTTQ